MGALRILVADDHEVFRRGLRSLLESRSDWEICGEASNGIDAVEKTKELEPDIVVLDVNMPGMSGLDAARVIRKEVPHSEVVILSQYEPGVMLKAALETGARSYVAKSQVSQELLAAVEAAAKHQPTPLRGRVDRVSSQLQTEKQVSEIEERVTSREFDCFSGGGEMGALMRTMDWSKTRLGPVERWPQSLKTAVSTCLNSRFAMLIWWGPDLIMLYNDAYRQIIGAKHPSALGNPGRQCWHEIWNTIGPMLHGVIARGEATWSDDLLLILERYGYPEECYFTFSYSPIRDESGGVGGVFTPVSETTQKVIGERQLQTLRDLAARSAEAKDEAEMWTLTAKILGDNPYDLPFAVFYRVGSDRKVFEPTAWAGLPANHKLCQSHEISDDCPELYQALLEVAQTGQTREVGELQNQCADLPLAPWNARADTAVVLPITLPGQHLPSGVLLAGVSPRKRLDDSYRTFCDLVARQVASSLAETRAYAEERRRAEALAEIDRAKTAFFSNVSHEFRTPLTLMLGPLEDLLTKPAKDFNDDEREQLAVVLRNGLRLMKLVNTLLDFSRIEAGRIEAVYEPTELSSLTADLASVFRSAMERAGLKLAVNCPTLPEAVYVDRDMWEKIVLNLLSNAFKFTLQGEIAVELRAAGNAVELEVRDTGTGIPEHEVAHIFERFHRVQGAQSRTQEGTGIGLALVHELVKLHEGSIRVESKEGCGSRFVVSIPLGSAHLPADRVRAARMLTSTALGARPYVQEAMRWLPSTEDSGAGSFNLGDTSHIARQQAGLEESGAHILVADDNADMRQYLQRMLSEEYQVEVAADGSTALQMARERPPDLVLSDIMMPGLDGFSLMRELRKDAHLNQVPVILLSARAGEDSRVEGLQSGADDYLVKPFSARELLARIHAHLSIARIRKESRQREQRLLRESELERNRLQELFMEAPAPIGMLTGTELRWTFVNSAYVKVTGRHSVQDFLGKTIRESLPEIEGQGYIELLENVYRSGTPFIGKEMKARLNRMDSGLPAEGYFDFIYQPLRNISGGVDGVLVYAVEVTEQVLGRKIVEGSEQYFRSFFRAAPVGMLLLDMPNRRLQDLNEAFCETTGYRPEQLLGRDFFELIYAEDREGQEKAFEQFQRDASRIYKAEFRIQRNDNKKVWISLAANVVSRGTENPEHIIAVAADITARKRVEDAQFRLAAIVESSDDAIVSKNLDGVIQTWNAGAQRIFGYQESEIVGKPITTIIPPELQYQETEILRKLRAGERIEHFQAVRLAKDGRRVEVSLTISPIKDSQGRVIGASKIARDISQQKQVEEALRQSEAQFRALADTIPQLAWMANPDGWIFWYNRRWYEYTGTTPEQMEGWGWQSVHDPQILPSVLERWKASLAKGQPFEMEFPLKGADGQYRWFLTRSTPLRDSEGHVQRWFGTNTNIHEQLESRRQLQENQERLNIALAASQTGTFRWDPQSGRFLDFDQNLKRLFGVAPDDSVKTTEDCLSRVYPDDLPGLRAALEKCRGGADLEMEYRVMLPDGGIRWLYDRAKYVAKGKDETAYLVGACTDITSRKQAQQDLVRAHDMLEERVRERTAELERAEQSLRHLSGRLLQMQDEERRRIARELHDSAGQMIVALDMNLYTLKQETDKLSPTAAAAVDQSIEVAQQMSQELRTISHLLHPPLLDEAGLESAIRWFVEGFAERSKVEVDLELSEDLGRLPRDLETTIFRLVQESLTNIHRHSGSSTAEIRITRKTDQITAQIRDRGKGMPADILRGPSGPVRPGVGIQGMRERVRQLGGRVEIESSSSGTVVRVFLPVPAGAEKGNSEAVGLAS